MAVIGKITTFYNIIEISRSLNVGAKLERPT